MPTATAPAAEVEGRDIFPWLFDTAPLTDAPLAPVEQQALGALDATLALAAVPDNLLPRAAAQIPQLIAMLRQTELPTKAIANQVGKDAVLAAELMRLATSAYYRAQGTVANIEQAITLIGLQGLQTVIARVLLKPIYRGAPGPLSARAMPRLWEHSEALAQHTAVLAAAAGQNAAPGRPQAGSHPRAQEEGTAVTAFDGYLAGLLHDTGWTVALGVIDRAGITLALPPSALLARALDLRVYRLFGQAAQRWEITPGFTAFAHAAWRQGPASATHPMAPVLQQALLRCMQEASPA